MGPTHRSSTSPTAALEEHAKAKARRQRRARSQSPAARMHAQREADLMEEATAKLGKDDEGTPSASESEMSSNVFSPREKVHVHYAGGEGGSTITAAPPRPIHHLSSKNIEAAGLESPTAGRKSVLVPTPDTKGTRRASMVSASAVSSELTDAASSRTGTGGSPSSYISNRESAASHISNEATSVATSLSSERTASTRLAADTSSDDVSTERTHDDGSSLQSWDSGAEDRPAAKDSITTPALAASPADYPKLTLTPAPATQILSPRETLFPTFTMYDSVIETHSTDESGSDDGDGNDEVNGDSGGGGELPEEALARSSTTTRSNSLHHHHHHHHLHQEAPATTAGTEWTDSTLVVVGHSKLTLETFASPRTLEGKKISLWTRSLVV